MKFYGDYHTHSVYSDGRAKISDAALYAGKIGLKELAVTDHGFANVTLSLTIQGHYCSFVTVHTPLSREVFWHEYAKIPRHTSQNFIAAGNLE